MGGVLRRLVDVVLLRAGPQALPASRTLAAGCVTAYVAVGVAVLGARMGPAKALAEGILDAAMLAAFAWGLLRLRGWPNRFLQTYTALTGTGALLGLLAWAPMAAAWRAEQLGGEVPAVLGVALLGLVAWTLLVIAHILRHALELPLLATTAMALAYVLFSWWVLALVFPQ
ncbi:MAG TPA: hypothetical protein ENK20_01260 [Chromatiales bacterium]|nr:hypothetical protein [Chromatiales bacterium]